MSTDEVPFTLSMFSAITSAPPRRLKDMAVAGSNRSLVAHLCFLVKDSHTELDMSGAEDKAVVTRYPHTMAHTQRGEKAVTSEICSIQERDSL